MNTLLVIFAHPDDESHGPAGTLAKCVQQGVQVHYLCATRGEAGIVDDKFLQNGGTVAELRTREVTMAAAELGLASVHFMGYRDSGMEGSADNTHPMSLYSAPLIDIARKIAEYIRLFRPDAIITHDQYGWYGHPDHIKCYHATLLAYQLLFGLHIEPGKEMPSLAYVPRLYVSSPEK